MEATSRLLARFASSVESDAIDECDLPLPKLFQVGDSVLCVSERFTFASAFLIVAIAALIGCDRGPRIVPVSGQVLIDGQPLTTGFVRFIPTGHRPAYGEIDKQGRFRLTTGIDYEFDGCVVGTHQVEVVAKEFPNETSTRFLVPKKYADLSTSDVSVEITEPTQDLKIELTWDGGGPFVEQSQNSGDVAP